MMDAQITSMHHSMTSFMSSNQNSYQQGVTTILPPGQASYPQGVPQGTNSFVYMDGMQQMQPGVVQGGSVMGQNMVNMVTVLS